MHGLQFYPRYASDTEVAAQEYGHRSANALAMVRKLWRSATDQGCEHEVASLLSGHRGPDDSGLTGEEAKAWSATAIRASVLRGKNAAEIGYARHFDIHGRFWDDNAPKNHLPNYDNAPPDVRQALRLTETKACFVNGGYGHYWTHARAALGVIEAALWYNKTQTQGATNDDTAS